MIGPVYAAAHDLVAPELLELGEDLDVVARWVVEGFLHGLHRSPYVGFSVEFASHREYVPGDDLRHLNWKLFGRHDRLYVKEYDAETNLDLHLVVDVSRSMTGGQGSTKFRYAALLAAALAHLSARQRDAVGLTLFADRVIEHMRARANPDHRMELLHLLANVREHPAAESARVLHEVAELMPRRGLVVLVSDLYFEVEELLSALSHFRHFGHDLLVFHVLTPLERRLDVDGPVRFDDLESGRQITTQAHEIRQAFTAAVDEWTTTLERGCLGRELDYAQLLTDAPLERALYDYFVKRSQLY